MAPTRVVQSAVKAVTKGKADAVYAGAFGACQVVVTSVSELGCQLKFSSVCPQQMWLYLGLLPSQELRPSQQALAHGHVRRHVEAHPKGSTYNVGNLPGSLGADEPGNEDGYVVKMTDDDLSPPYKIAPGTRVRLESLYEGDNRLLVRPGLVHNSWNAGKWPEMQLVHMRVGERVSNAN